MPPPPLDVVHLWNLVNLERSPVSVETILNWMSYYIEEKKIKPMDHKVDGQTMLHRVASKPTPLAIFEAVLKLDTRVNVLDSKLKFTPLDMVFKSETDKSIAKKKALLLIRAGSVSSRHCNIDTLKALLLRLDVCHVFICAFPMLPPKVVKRFGVLVFGKLNV